MSKRKPPLAKQPELALRPYDATCQSLIEQEHYDLEYARLIDAVHNAFVSGAREHMPEESVNSLVARGLIVLALNNPDTYSAIVRNHEAKATLETINDAADTINDALGLTWGKRVTGGDGDMFGVTFF